MRGLYVGKSGMLSFQEKMDTISNNIANVQTAGYKKLTSSFRELLRDEIGMLGTPLTDEIEAKNPTIGTGVKIGSAYRVNTQGVLIESGNPIECSIDGEGFFGYLDAAGNFKMSRVANLTLNPANGMLTDEQGNTLLVENGVNFFDYRPDTITVGTDGQITVDDEYGQKIDAGRIIMYYVPNKDVLIDSGQGYFMVSDDAGVAASNDANVPADVFGKMRQGYYEASNADIGTEMIDLMVTQRGYQLSLKAVQTADEMWGQANNILKR